MCVYKWLNNEGWERRRPRTAKAENGKGLGAGFSTRSASCQGKTLKDTWDILMV